jgi:hypothetical protein
MQSPGDDLHGLWIGSPGTNVTKVPAPRHQHSVPPEQRLVIQLHEICAPHVRHQLGCARLGSIRASVVSLEAKMPRQRRLHARSVEDLAFDRRAVDRLLRDQVNGQRLLLVIIDMQQCPHDHAGTTQEAFLR